MNGNSFFNKGLLQALLSLILVIALGVGLFVPGADMETAQPDNPLDAQEVLDISVLEVSENISSLTPVVVPTGGRATSQEPEENEEESDNEEAEADDGSENGDQDGDQDGLQGEAGGTQVPKLAVILSWKENRKDERSLACQPGGTISADVLNTSLSGGALDYEVSLFGEDTGDAFIESVFYETDSSSAEISKKGTIYLQGGTYKITVTVLIDGNRVPFRFDLNHISDVTLKMEYTVLENGSSVTRETICENTKTRYPEDIYTDQLTNGMLDYNFSIVGAAGAAEITSVKCFQTATGTSVSIDPSGSIELLLDGGKRAENTFYVLAEGENGKSYNFTISMYYKPRGAEILQIDTYDHYDGMIITTGSNMNLRLSAYRPEGGSKVYIPAEGADTEFTVTFNGSPIYPVTSNGRVHDYIVVPPDPVIRDENEHILTIYAEDDYGNWGKKTLNFIGKRAQAGQVVGTAQIYVDMTVLGLGIRGPLQYEVRAGEPCSFVVLKALAGWDMGEIFGANPTNFDMSVGYDSRDVYNPKAPFFLDSINPGLAPIAIETVGWAHTESGEIDLDAIDSYFPGNPEIATLWRCLANNGLDPTGNAVPEDGISSLDYTGASGWMYRINNGPFAGLGLEGTTLNDGDTLTLAFTLAGGWDIGGTGDLRHNSSGYCIHAEGGRLVPNQDTTHRMDGDRCVCCGRVETCLHEMVFEDKGNGCHVEKCRTCGYESAEQEHEYQWIDGDYDYHYCTYCPSRKKHFWPDTDKVIIKEPSCTEAGETHYTCSQCGMDKTEYPPAGHIFGEGELVSEMAFDMLGHYRVCQRCKTSKDYIYFRFYWDDAEWMYKCMCSSDCTHTHDWESSLAFGCDIEPPVDESLSTCTLEVRYCSTCGNYLYKPGMYPQRHSWIESTTEATCTSDGYHERICPDCGADESGVIDALGHSYDGGVCTRCGEADPASGEEPDAS